MHGHLRSVCKLSKSRSMSRAARIAFTAGYGANQACMLKFFSQSQGLTVGVGWECLFSCVHSFLWSFMRRRSCRSSLDKECYGVCQVNNDEE